MTEQDLAGRGVVVTGSSRGIGAATAELLAARGAGVVVNYRQKAPRANKVVQKIEEAGGRAVAVGGDVTSAEDRAALLDAAVESFGSLDVLVLNASGGMESQFGEDYAMKLNRDAQAALADAAVERMSAGGQIVFVTSHQAHFINEVETMDSYEPVARSKRAGEDALRERIPAFTASCTRSKGISTSRTPPSSASPPPPGPSRAPPCSSGSRTAPSRSRSPACSS